MKTFMELLERLIFKITSGRFIFTVVCAFVFAVGSIRGIIPIDKVQDILLIVITFYFAMKRNDNGNGKLPENK